MQMALGFVLPIVALATHTPWVDVRLPEFFLRVLPVYLVVFGVTVWFKSNGWLRPKDAELISWEIYLFQLTRWPWVFLGVDGSSTVVDPRDRPHDRTGDGQAPLEEPRLALWSTANTLVTTTDALERMDRRQEVH
jgi:hypothetical protein